MSAIHKYKMMFPMFSITLASVQVTPEMVQLAARRAWRSTGIVLKNNPDQVLRSLGMPRRPGKTAKDKANGHRPYVKNRRVWNGSEWVKG